MESAEKEAYTSEEDTLFKSAMRDIVNAQQALNAATEKLLALHDPATRGTSAVDDHGEPTWNYLVKVGLPADIRLTKKFIDYAKTFGFNEESANTLMHGKGTYEGFIKYYQRVGRKWQRWSLVWQKWVRTEHDRKQKAQSGNGRSTRFDQQRTRG